MHKLKPTSRNPCFPSLSEFCISGLGSIGATHNTSYAVEWGFICIVEWGCICIVEWGFICIVEQGLMHIAEWGMIGIAKWGIIHITQ